MLKDQRVYPSHYPKKKHKPCQAALNSSKTRSSTWGLWTHRIYQHHFAATYGAFLKWGSPKPWVSLLDIAILNDLGYPPTSGNLHCPYLSVSTHVYLSIYLCIYPSILLSIYRPTYYVFTQTHACNIYIYIYIYTPYLSLAQNNHININKTATKLRKTKQNTYLRYTFTLYSMVVDTSKHLYAYR